MRYLARGAELNPVMSFLWLRMRGRLAVLVDPTHVQTGQTELQKDQSKGSIMKTPNNPQNVTEEK
jgi:hypothetical protein